MTRFYTTSSTLTNLFDALCSETFSNQPKATTQSGYNFYYNKNGEKVNIISDFGQKDYVNFYGYKKSDIEKAEMKDNVLTITFKKNASSSKYVVEGERYFALPKDTDKDKVSIKLEDGILSIITEEAEKEVTKVSVL